MLRILNGGVEASPVLDPDRLEMVTGVRPEQYLDLAALRGDVSDNLPGVPGIGPKTAARLLAEFGSATAAFDDACSDGERCRRVVGAGITAKLRLPEARAAWELNRSAMEMVCDAPLGLDLPNGVGCLPLDETPVRTMYARLDLHVPTAVRALTGKEPSPPRPVDIDASWRPPRSYAPMRFPPLPKQPEPASVQETLF
jgi:DNA polymerase-1